MAPELYTHSNRKHMSLKFGKSLRESHQQSGDAQAQPHAGGVNASKRQKRPTTLWEEDEDNDMGGGVSGGTFDDFAGDDGLLDGVF